MAITILPIIKILVIAAISFIIALFSTPILTHFLYKYKLGKRIRNDGKTPIFTALHKNKEGTPTMGGILIWAVVAFLCFGILLLSKLLGPDTIFSSLNFLTRQQTLLPLGILLFAAIVGLGDDLIGISKIGGKRRG